MADPTDDAERIAALLDGNLDARQRAEVLARLDASDAAFEAFVDAAAVMREAQPQRTSSVWRWNRAPLAIAAAILIGAVIPLIWSRKASTTTTDVRQLAALAWAGGLRLPPDWNGTPWSTTRGEDQPLTPSARAARVGARLVDLDLAVRGGDTTVTRIATDIAALLEPLPASGPILTTFRQIATRPPQDERALLSSAAPAAADLAGKDMSDIGAWIEALRLAAARSDAVRYRQIATPAMIGRARTILQHNDAASPLLDRIGAGADWAAHQRDLTALLQTLTS